MKILRTYYVHLRVMQSTLLVLYIRMARLNDVGTYRNFTGEC